MGVPVRGGARRWFARGGACWLGRGLRGVRARPERAPAFLKEIGVAALDRYADPSGDAFESLRLSGKALGLPTTLLIDKEGCEIGLVAGPAQWTSPEALAAVAALKGG